MTRVFYKVLLISAALWLSSCCACRKPVKAYAYGEKWLLVEQSGVVVERSDGADKYTLILGEDMNFSGKAICNDYRGSYSIDNKTGSISLKLVSLDGDCPSSESEGAYFDLLRKARRFKFDGQYIIFSDDTGAVIATFRSSLSPR